MEIFGRNKGAIQSRIKKLELEEKYSKKPSLIIAKIPHLDDKEFHAKLVHKLQFTDITSV